MSKIRWVLLILFVLVIAVIVVLLFIRRPHQEVVPEAALPAPSIAEIEQEEAPPLPDISFKINAQSGVSVLQGTPLIFTVRLANPAAANTLALNQAHEQSLAMLQEKVAKGELSAQDAQPMLELAGVKHEVKTVRLGSQERGWEQFLHFEVQSGVTTFAPLNWPLTLVRSPEAKSVLLDGNANVEIQYALNSQAAAQVPAGEYTLLAVLEVAEDKTLTPELWRGRIVSLPVQLKITSSAEPLSAADRANQSMQQAEFFSATGDWAHALQSSQEALKEDPNLIRGQMIQGQAKEAQGDLAGAREAFLEALRLFDEQYPDSYEQPQYLMYKIASLDERLGNRPPKPKP
jgi:tetratricopeptide (TPR) repeat protein